MTNYKLFEVKNFDKTLSKHRAKIDMLGEEMQNQNIGYEDILDSYAWQTIDTQTDEKVRMIRSVRGENMKAREIATIINALTRTAIIGSLIFFEIPKSYDTAFFLANYMKVIEGMSEILEISLERQKND